MIRYVGVVAAVLVLAMPATAAAPPDVKKLQRQIATLTVQLNTARADIQTLQQAVTDLQAQVNRKADTTALQPYAKQADLDTWRKNLTDMGATVIQNQAKLNQLSDFTLCTWKREGDLFDYTWDVAGIMWGSDVYRSNLGVSGGGRDDQGACARAG